MAMLWGTTNDVTMATVGAPKCGWPFRRWLGWKACTKAAGHESRGESHG